MTAVVQVESDSASRLARRELCTLLRHSSHYLAGLSGGLVVGLVSFPIFTRAFSPAEYGLMDLAQRVVVMLAIASKAGLQNAVLRFYDKDRFAADPPEARRFYSTMYLGTLGTALAVTLVFLAFRGLIPGRIWGPIAGLSGLVLSLALLRSLAATLWGFLRIEERTKAFNATTVGTRAATVAAILALLPLAGRTAHTYFLGTVMVEGVLVLALTAALLRRKVLRLASFDSALFRAGVMFGLPLVVYELAFAALGSADRFLVRHYLGANVLGFYSVAYGLAEHAGDLLVGPLVLAILPIYMRIWTSSGPRKTTEFLNLVWDLFLMAAAGILAIAIATARPLVVLLASSRYAGTEHLIPLLLGGLFIYANYVFVAAGLLIQKRTMTMAGLLVVAAVFNIALNCLLLPVMGLNGAALASLLSYALCILLLARASSRVLPLRLDAAACAKYLAAGAAAACAGRQIGYSALVPGILSRGAVSLAVYLLILYALDRRVRGAALRAVRAVKT